MKKFKFLFPFLALVFLVSCEMETVVPKWFPQDSSTKVQDQDQETRNFDLITIVEEISLLEGKELMPDDLLFSEEYEPLLNDFGDTYNYGDETKIIYLQINEMIVPTMVSTLEFENAIYTKVGGGLTCTCESDDDWCLVGNNGPVQYCDDIGCAECCITFIPNDNDLPDSPVFQEIDGFLYQVEQDDNN